MAGARGLLLRGGAVLLPSWGTCDCFDCSPLRGRCPQLGRGGSESDTLCCHGAADFQDAFPTSS
eukprot:3589977-Lingulodinium_polyedra.AAC.1